MGLGLALAIIVAFSSSDIPGFLSELLSLDSEQSFATWYSSVLLAVGGTLSFLVGARRERSSLTKHWTALGWILWVLSLDEIVSLHERSAFGATLEGLLMVEWVIPGTVGVLVLGGWFLVRFFPLLAPPLRRGVLIAAAVYVVGALGFEFLEAAVGSGLIFGHTGEESFTFALVVVAQESLEIAGLVLFVSALLRELRRTDQLRIAFE